MTYPLCAHCHQVRLIAHIRRSIGLCATCERNTRQKLKPTTRIDPERERALAKVLAWNKGRFMMPGPVPMPRFHRTLEQIEALLEREAA